MIIGLTGGIATGKSTVSKLFQEKGILVCDSDVIAKQIVQKGEEGLNRLVQQFGTSILDNDGNLNRKVLSDIIFDDATAREKVNQILHPLVFLSIEKWKNQHANESLLIIDMPLLFEVGYDSKVDAIILVTASIDQQIARLNKRNGYSTEEAIKRIKSQWPLTQKLLKSDFIIDNSGTIEQTKNQVSECLKKLLNML